MKLSIGLLVINLAVVSSCAALETSEMHYVDESDNDATLMLSRIDEHQLNFIALGTLKNAFGNCVLHGVASNIGDLGEEVNEDELLGLYPVDEFDFDDGRCFIAFRIQFDTGERLQIGITPCAEGARSQCKTTIIRMRIVQPKQRVSVK